MLDNVTVKLVYNNKITFLLSPHDHVSKIILLYISTSLKNHLVIKNNFSGWPIGGCYRQVLVFI